MGSGSHTSTAATPSPAPPRDSVPVPVPPHSEPRKAQSPSGTARAVTSGLHGAPCDGHEAMAAVLPRLRFISGCGRRGYIKRRRRRLPGAVTRSRRYAGALSSAQHGPICRGCATPGAVPLGWAAPATGAGSGGSPRAWGCCGLRRVVLRLRRGRRRWRGGSGSGSGVRASLSPAATKRPSGLGHLPATSPGGAVLRECHPAGLTSPKLRAPRRSRSPPRVAAVRLSCSRSV